jgi:dGTPase
MTSKSKHLLTELFERLLEEPNLLPTEWQTALENKGQVQQARIIADYVASMTDRYALLEYERIFEPGPILS